MGGDYLPQLIMRRPDQPGPPALDLPVGYSLHRCPRVFTERERGGIARVLAGAFTDATWLPERVESVFVGDPACSATFYITRDDTDEVVATATAREDDSFPGVGYLHFVAVSPDQRGKHLGYCVSLAVLHEFARSGLRGAVLTTDDHRVAAIVTYLRLGFAPLLAHASHAVRWEAVLKQIASRHRSP